jgi:hypothetical protein
MRQAQATLRDVVAMPSTASIEPRQGDGAAGWGPLVMGAAACFVRTMTEAAGSMHGPWAPLLGTLLMLVHSVGWRVPGRSARRAVSAPWIACTPAAGPRALAAPPGRCGF